MTAPAEPITPPATEPASAATVTEPGKAPNFEGEFDPARAARLVENLRQDVAKRDADLAAVKRELESKGAAEKTVADRIASLESRAAEAERSLLVAQAAKAHSIPEDLVHFLNGKTAEELEAQGKALASHLKAPAEEVPGRPRPRLTSVPGEIPPEPFDAAKVAAEIRKR